MLRIGLGLGLVICVLGRPCAQGLDKGAWEFSGMGAWSYSDDSGPGPNTVTTSLLLSSVLLAYPSRYFFVGPLLDYSRVLSESEGNMDVSAKEILSKRWDLGLKTGFLVNWSDAPFRPLPYLGASVGLSVLSLDIEESDILAEDTSIDENGHFFGFFIGSKLRLSESFYMNIQPTLTFISIGDREITDFRVGAGFSGRF